MSCRTGYSNMSGVVRLDLVYDGLVASHVHLPPQLLGRGGGCLTLIAVALDQKPKIMASLHLCLHHLAPFFGHPILTPVFFPQVGDWIGISCRQPPCVCWKLCNKTQHGFLRAYADLSSWLLTVEGSSTCSYHRQSCDMWNAFDSYKCDHDCYVTQLGSAAVLPIL